MLRALGLAGLCISSCFVAVPVVAQEQKQEVKKVSIAVFDFTIPTDKEKIVVQVGDKRKTVAIEKETAVLTNKLITALVKTNKFSVVERDKLETVMKEFRLSEGGITDPARSQKAGKLIGADYLLHGSISLFNASVGYKKIPYTDSFNEITEVRLVVDIRLVETETGKIVVAETCNKRDGSKGIVGSASRTDVDPVIIEQLQRTVSEELVTNVVDGIYPIKVVSLKDEVVYINRGQEGSVRKDEMLKVVTVGKELRDPDTNAILGHEDTDIATIQIIEIQPKLSKAKVIEWKTKEKDIPKGSICRRVKQEAKQEGQVPEKPRLPGND